MSHTDSLRIIVADDEAVIRMGLKTMLHALGYKVIATARNGQEAIEKVKLFGPDLLLLDIKMPDMDGLTAAQVLAEEAPLPIVMLTAYSHKALVEKAINAFVMGYLVKPIDENRLRPNIELAVARYREIKLTATQADHLRRYLAEREFINQAKHNLMEQGLSEDEAYHYIQAAARKRQINLNDMAKRIISRGQS